jgi:hypothetical protein
MKKPTRFLLSLFHADMLAGTLVPEKNLGLDGIDFALADFDISDSDP